MAGWAAFVGLTGLVVLSMLGLARLSTRAIEGGGVAVEPGGPAGPGATVDPRLPRFEPARAHALRTSARTGPEERGLSTAALLANVALTQGLFGGAVVLAAVYFEIPWDAFGLGGPDLSLGAVAVGAALGVALWVVTEAVGNVADAAGVGYDESLRGMLAPSSAGGWVVLLGAILPTVALVEELLFRGAAIGVVVVGLETPAWAMVLVSSLAFGAAHGAQGRVGMALATGLGLALAGAFVATGSLLVVVVAHYLVNALEFVVHEGLGFDPLSG